MVAPAKGKMTSSNTPHSRILNYSAVRKGTLSSFLDNCPMRDSASCRHTAVKHQLSACHESAMQLAIICRRFGD